MLPIFLREIMPLSDARAVSCAGAARLGWETRRRRLKVLRRRVFIMKIRIGFWFGCRSDVGVRIEGLMLWLENRK